MSEREPVVEGGWAEEEWPWKRSHWKEETFSAVVDGVVRTERAQSRIVYDERTDSTSKEIRFDNHPTPVGSGHMRQDEINYVTDSQRCSCGHLLSLHNFHCCTFCLIPGCECTD